ncbi:hypothetical protein FisN_21Hh153 [Fistulifera solaris]|uniref:Ubiquitin-like domain-containing protein n=1 Tax=Fistulifera solaris TaxID=1519565 RepID=A0A1Z5JS79_FISSO|nr:hypothetical protein FisN_21Hh153 [Fistulifera solaris]|eukprot:GAX16712.1 hypothetical protein FisN_21Hh153 [Fistulifera solaris]
MALVSTPRLVETVPHASLEHVNVFFRFVDGQTLCLWLDPDMDIASIKEALVVHKQKTQEDASLVWASRDLFLIWNGKPLVEDATLRDYGYSKGTISVSYRNRGGCFMVSFSILMMILAAVCTSCCTCGLSLLAIPLLLPLLFVLPFFCL